MFHVKQLLYLTLLENCSRMYTRGAKLYKRVEYLSVMVGF